MLFRNAENVYQSERLLKFDWLMHGFGTRLSERWPGTYTGAKQVHSDRIFNADETDAERIGEGRIGEGDALITRTAGRIVGIRTADCVPILLVDPRRQAVAAVHAGWRGTVQNIAGKTVQRLSREYGTSASDVLAVIGPAIGECCYEVGHEVAAQFADLLGDRREARHIDLQEANRRQLVAAGVPAGSIETAGLCTRCGEEFHSWRRDKEASGRMVAAIGIRREQ